MSFEGYTTATWAGTLLVEEEITQRTSPYGDAPDPEEYRRAEGVRMLAMERLTSDRAKGYGDLNVKLTVAIELLRSGLPERGQELLAAIATDTRLLELEAALDAGEVEPEVEPEAEGGGAS